MIDSADGMRFYRATKLDCDVCEFKPHSSRRGEPKRRITTIMSLRSHITLGRWLHLKVSDVLRPRL